MPSVFLRPFISKTSIQLVVRAILGILGLHAMNSLGVSFRSRLRPLFGARFLLITFTQFHVVFYSARTLPNTFAFVTVMYALGSLLRGLDCQFIMLSGLGILVFRCELMLLYAPLLIFGLYFQFVKIRPVLIATGLLTTLVAISINLHTKPIINNRRNLPKTIAESICLTCMYLHFGIRYLDTNLFAVVIFGIDSNATS
uniref:Mannosyltransferase n=1 Tax=Mesocestoides corti TaxID=53468 RepID=A0A5K3FCR1_MESCO